MRIAHVNTEAGWGGGEAQTEYLALGLVEAGHDCTLYLNRRGRLYEQARRKGLRVRAIPGSRLPNPASVLFLAEEFLLGGFDVCHLHTAHAVATGTVAAAGNRRIRKVATRRLSYPLGRNRFGWKGPWKALDHIIAVSEWVRKRLLLCGVPPDRITVIHSAVDLVRFESRRRESGFREEVGIRNGQVLIGNISRLTARKGQVLFIEAAALLMRLLPEARFVIVGEGELSGELAHRVRSRGLEGVLRMTGFREDIPAILGSMDCLVFPAASGEGSPGVLKEAMAAGVPIVAADQESVREIVASGREALLVSSGDPGSLALAVHRVIRDSDLARSLVRHARRQARRFSLAGMVAATEAVYGKVLNGKSGRTAL